MTICTHQRECLLGEVVGGVVVLNPYGQIVCDCWQETPDHFPNVELDAFVVMRNHVHAIIVIVGDMPVVGATHASPLPRGPTGPSDALSPPRGRRQPTRPSRVSPPREPHPTNRPRGPQPRSLGAIVGSFKSAVTRRINQRRGSPGARVWQRGYHDHIIRNAAAMDRIRAYIAANPARWGADRLNPLRAAPAAVDGPYPWEEETA